MTCCTPRENAHKSVSTFRPSIDVFESESSFTIIADLPGATAESIDLDFDQNTLTLSARVPARHVEGRQVLGAEYQVGDYRRAFRFDELIESAEARASYEGGVLTVSLPKSEASRRRKVRVNAG